MLIPVTKVVSFSFGCALLINSPKNKKLSSHFLDLFCFRSSCQLSERLVLSNDKFRYPTNDKNSDPGVKLNNC